MKKPGVWTHRAFFLGAAVGTGRFSAAVTAVSFGIFERKRYLSFGNFERFYRNSFGSFERFWQESFGKFERILIRTLYLNESYRRQGHISFCCDFLSSLDGTGKASSNRFLREIVVQLKNVRVVNGSIFDGVKTLTPIFGGADVFQTSENNLAHKKYVFEGESGRVQETRLPKKFQ